MLIETNLIRNLIKLFSRPNNERLELILIIKINLIKNKGKIIHS